MRLISESALCKVRRPSIVRSVKSTARERSPMPDRPSLRAALEQIKTELRIHSRDAPSCPGSAGLTLIEDYILAVLAEPDVEAEHRARVKQLTQQVRELESLLAIINAQ